MLSDELKLLTVLKYEKDYWKELELKMVVGDEPLIDLEDFQKDVDQRFTQAKEQFDNLMKEIRRMVDKLEFVEITNLLTSYFY